MNRISLQRLIEQTLYGEILYHGSGMAFDAFDNSKSKEATDVAHHGYGTYLVNDPDTAKAYIFNYAIGGKGVLYTCKVSSDVEIAAWDDQIPEHTFMEMAEELEDIDGSLSEEMKNYPENYGGETFTYGDLYEILKSVTGYENPNEFFKTYDIDGFSGSNRINPDSIEYCIFDGSYIKIIDKTSIMEGE